MHTVQVLDSIFSPYMQTVHGWSYSCCSSYPTPSAAHSTEHHAKPCQLRIPTTNLLLLLLRHITEDQTPQSCDPLPLVLPVRPPAPHRLPLTPYHQPERPAKEPEGGRDYGQWGVLRSPRAEDRESGERSAAAATPTSCRKLQVCHTSTDIAWGSQTFVSWSGVDVKMKA